MRGAWPACRFGPAPAATLLRDCRLLPTLFGLEVTVLAPGTRAPDFRLPDHTGRVWQLDELRGTWVLLWWYPKASTPG